MIQDKIYNALKESAFLYLDDFMNISLRDEEHGYYTSNKAIGKDGDFVTAPEISQMFGEIIAVKILNLIHAKNVKKFNLIELGPGRGALINDITRVLNALLDEDVEYTIHFNEINKFYIQNLKNNYPNCKIHKNFNSYPNEFSIIIANEFFDAIPARQLVSRNGNIYETVIKLDKKDSLKFDFIKPRPDISKFVKNMQDLEHLEVIEFSPETNLIFRELINFLLMNNGFFLLIDYGYINLPKISTLQSIKSNKKTDFLDNPGNQDITYHVDFNNLQNILEENKIDDFIINTQSNFLRQNGILDRANILIKKNPKKEKQINEQLAILTKREYMGNLFKVLEINI